MSKTLKQLAKESHEMAVRKGWHDTDIIQGKPVATGFGDQLSNFHSELSEAWEIYRNGQPIDAIYFVGLTPRGIPIEFADLIIRVLDTCEHYGIDIEEAIAIKMEYNAGRQYRHGGKLA